MESVQKQCVFPELINATKNGNTVIYCPGSVNGTLGLHVKIWSRVFTFHVVLGSWIDPTNEKWKS